MSEGDETLPRPGSSQDLSRRMDRLESNHADLARHVGQLTSTVERVELNQTHAAELNKLRFDALDHGIQGVDSTLERFMGRINAIVSGEVKLPQAVAGEKMVAEYLVWKDQVDAFMAQGKLLARIAVLFVTSNLIAVIAAIFAALK